MIGKLEECYGEKKGTKIRIWADQVSPSQLDSNTWLVKFKKLEQSGVSSLSWILHFYTQKIKNETSSWLFFSGEEQMCCFTTVILSSKVTFFDTIIIVMKCGNVKCLLLVAGRETFTRVDLGACAPNMDGWIKE